MGCCASRPENEHGNGNTEQPAAVQDMTTAPRLPGPPQIFRELSNGPASSSNSVATSTAHQPVALNEHYNEPLRTHTWRTKANKRPWSYAKWKRMREEFFETQVTNRAEVWASLKAVVELLDHGEVETAQGIINASEITLPTGDLVDGAYDSFGNLYRLPPFAVSAPENMTENDEIKDSKTPEAGRGADTAQNDSLYPSSSNMPDAEKGQIVSETAKDLISVKARLSDRGGNGQDVTVKIGSQDSTKVLISLVAEKAGVPAEKIKIAYMGRILKSNKGFVAQGWQAGHVVNAMVLP